MSNRQRGGAVGVQPPRRQRRKPRAWTKRRRTIFLQALAETCNVSKAALAAGMDRSSAYDLKDRDPEFMRGWRRALEQAHGELEWDLLKKAKDGDVRTELTLDPETRKPIKIKLTHERRQAIAMRLLLSHKAEVLAFRCEERMAGEDDTANADARIRAQMDVVRQRLIERAAGPDRDRGD